MGGVPESLEAVEDQIQSKLEIDGDAVRGGGHHLGYRHEVRVVARGKTSRKARRHRVCPDVSDVTAVTTRPEGVELARTEVIPTDRRIGQERGADPTRRPPLSPATSALEG